MAKTIYAPGLSGVGTKARATKWIGDKFAPGWCLYWCLTQVYKVPGLGDYDRDGSADAEDYWKAAVKRGKVVHARDIKKLDEIPEGVLLMWTGGSGDHGHAAYCLGNGQMVSTDLPIRGQVGRVAISQARVKWGLTFVGYVLVDANGYTLTRAEPAKPPVKLDQMTRYKVTAESGLKGRKGPSTSSKQVWLAKHGTTVRVVAIAEGDGRQWAVNENGTHYALEYLRKID